tara:strand:- start:1255 stop:1479 length:225 start_codon:yes stop_codon:yes gene_type:complete
VILISQPNKNPSDRIIILNYPRLEVIGCNIFILNKAKRGSYALVAQWRRGRKGVAVPNPTALVNCFLVSGNKVS